MVFAKCRPFCPGLNGLRFYLPEVSAETLFQYKYAVLPLLDFLLQDMTISSLWWESYTWKDSLYIETAPIPACCISCVGSLIAWSM